MELKEELAKSMIAFHPCFILLPTAQKKSTELFSAVQNHLLTELDAGFKTELIMKSQPLLMKPRLERSESVVPSVKGAEPPATSEGPTSAIEVDSVGIPYEEVSNASMEGMLFGSLPTRGASPTLLVARLCVRLSIEGPLLVVLVPDGIVPVFPTREVAEVLSGPAVATL